MGDTSGERSWRRDDPTSVHEKLDLASRQGGSSVLRVSATEIIQELPKLSPAERRTVRRVLSDLAAKEEDVQLCNQVATEAAMMFDRMEEEDARRFHSCPRLLLV
jgi:tRNA A37 N6-isopentenylltransferase MiaA